MNTIDIKFRFSNDCVPGIRPDDSLLAVGFILGDPEMRGVLCFGISHHKSGVDDIAQGQLEIDEAKQLRDFLNYALRDL